MVGMSFGTVFVIGSIVQGFLAAFVLRFATRTAVRPLGRSWSGR
jgi:hypothetical protein